MSKKNKYKTVETQIDGKKIAKTMEYNLFAPYEIDEELDVSNSKKVKNTKYKPLELDTRTNEYSFSNSKTKEFNLGRKQNYSKPLQYETSEFGFDTDEFETNAYKSKPSNFVAATIEQKKELMQHKAALIEEINSQRKIAEELALRQKHIAKQERHLNAVFNEIEQLNKEIITLESKIQASKSKANLVQKTQEIQLMNSEKHEQAYNELEQMKEHHQALLLEYEHQRHIELEYRKNKEFIAKQEQEYKELIKQIHKLETINANLENKIHEANRLATVNADLAKEINNIQSQTREQELKIGLLEKENALLNKQLKEGKYTDVLKERNKFETIQKQQIDLVKKNQIELNHLTQENHLLVHEIKNVSAQMDVLSETRKQRKLRIKQEKKLQKEIQRQRDQKAEILAKNIQLRAELEKKKALYNPKEIKKQITQEVKLFSEQLGIHNQQAKATKELQLMLKENAQLEAQLSRIDQRNKFYEEEKHKLIEEAKRVHEETLEATLKLDLDSNKKKKKKK